MCKKKKKIERQKDLDIYQFTLIKRVEEELEKLYLNVILQQKKFKAPALLSRTCSTDNSCHFSNVSVGFLQMIFWLSS